MKEIVEIEAKLQWKWGKSSSGVYLATCEAISQTVQADRFADLIQIINEAIDSTFRELFETGDLHQFLIEQGWAPIHRKLPTPRSKRQVSFEVPFDLKETRSRDLEAMLC